MEQSLVIKVESVDVCPLCGNADRDVLYEGLTDQLYGVPGKWTYRKCRCCGLIFMTPRPTIEDAGKAYTVYPTHAPIVLPDNLPRRLRSYVWRGYLANRFGYVQGVSRLQRIIGWLAYLHPGQREYANGNIMHLPASRRGRVLDVGCGTGYVINELRTFGWDVEGVDPDLEAADVAWKAFGLKIGTGMLEDQSYPSDKFDAVLMNHVIEHVHDPVNLLRECHRILRPGGLLVVATPNAESLGHNYFGANWRVLEPPRHLTIFSSRTLFQLAEEAGFSTPQIRTTIRGADGVYIESKKLGAMGAEVIGQNPASTKEKVAGQIFQYWECANVYLRPGAGEELLMVVEK